MGVRKNAKFLTPTERENFVKACVLMKADIVNPAAPVAQQYSRWDELTALHRMIQNAFSPAGPNINFGHGGSGSYSFLSWHRYFLYHVEQRLQSYVPGVMIPYWDWTDPAPIMTNAFLGPNGGAGGVVSSGCFAATAPGTAGNPTPAPAWWPAGLDGWTMPPTYDIDGGFWIGPLRRNLAPLAQLPSANDLRTTLNRTTYPSFQNTLESGSGLASGNQLHNGMHGWIGGANGHMSSPAVSPHDPLFYLHHCNIDRIWAMWQADGHASDYPVAGGDIGHHRNDIMFPWTGGAAGWGTNISIGVIAMPDLSAVGAKRNVDTLDHRAFGYTYDTLPIVGIGLDRTGSMLGVTPDPMVAAAPTVSKWTAASRGVSAFLQDCEVARDSGVAGVIAGVRTFRSLAANVFDSVFPGTPYGLVRQGSAYSRSSFDTLIATLAPGGGTPLADALTDVSTTLVEPPGTRVPDETRYLVMLTDGQRTSGSLISDIPDGSIADTAVFAMGFGTAGDVDYPTLAQLTAKGKTLPFNQVFHGENAGTIDKFYTNAVARAIGFVPIIDPVIELFEGEHSHFSFDVTSAEESLMLTAQGMDFDDKSWSYHLVGPDGATLFSDGMAGMAGMEHDMGTLMGRRPDVVARRENARLTLIVQRDSADRSAWVGGWQLMISYRSRDMDRMVMTTVGELLWPVAAGPARGPRWSRLRQRPGARDGVLPRFAGVVGVQRNLGSSVVNGLAVPAPSTNRGDRPASSVVVNIYGRSRLALDLVPAAAAVKVGEKAEFDVAGDALTGRFTVDRAVARQVSPSADVAAVLRETDLDTVGRGARLPKENGEATFDLGLVLASVELKRPDLAALTDIQPNVARHGDGPPHVHLTPEVAGGTHLGLYLSGTYYPDAAELPAGHEAHDHGGDHDAAAPEGRGESFVRIFSSSLGVTGG